jgi:hypothetical protein
VLKRACRDILLVGNRRDVRIVYLKGDRDLIAQRLAARDGHFMPSSLLDSQFEALKETGLDECPIVVSIVAHPRTIVDLIKRRPSMATNETEPIQRDPIEPPVVAETAAPTPPPTPEPTPFPAPAPAPVPAADPDRESGVADKLRAEFAEIAAIAAQGGRLGVTIDAADAVRKGVSADALRRSVLDTLAARAEATTVIAPAPSPGPAPAGDSPIVRRAKERATAARA